MSSSNGHPSLCRDGALAVLEAATGAVLCESATLRRPGAAKGPAPGLALCGVGAVAALAWPDRLAVFSVPWSTQAVEVLAVYDVDDVGPCPSCPGSPPCPCPRSFHAQRRKHSVDFRGTV